MVTTKVQTEFLLSLINLLRAARAGYGNQLKAVQLCVAAHWGGMRNHIHLTESN